MKRFICLSILLIVSVVGFSQGAIKRKHQLSDKVFFGGGFGMQFGSVNAVEVSPMVGYKPMANLYVGFKGTYQFYKSNIYDYSTDIYGGSLFAMYSAFTNVAFYAEYEMLSLETEYFDPFNVHSDKTRFWVNSPLIGGGFIQPMGERSKLLILMLWSLDDSVYSPYSNPVIRLTFLY